MLARVRAVHTIHTSTSGKRRRPLRVVPEIATALHDEDLVQPASTAGHYLPLVLDETLWRRVGQLTAALVPHA